ncbi:MAG: DUF459 domain-containing protein [Rhodospirillaceae bacterium]|nr:DUF459 domain-containing protein [Rhodospirillaceae bacterium]
MAGRGKSARRGWPKVWCAALLLAGVLWVTELATAPVLADEPVVTEEDAAAADAAPADQSATAAAATVADDALTGAPTDAPTDAVAADETVEAPDETVEAPDAEAAAEPADDVDADAAADAGDTVEPGDEANDTASLNHTPTFDGPIHILVIGDSLADGLWAGVYRRTRGFDDVTVERHTRVSSGLSRPDYYDWNAEIDEVIADEDMDIAIVSIGLNDGQPVFYEGRWDHDFGTEEWDRIYRERVVAFMTELADAGIPTFWLGLPTVRSAEFDQRVQHMNDIYREAAAETGVYFVETRAITADASGAYAAYLNDEDGRQRLMRANDGIHFTGPGYEMLGQALVDAIAQALGVLTDADGPA